MTDINSVVIVGRLTREAELKYTNSGTAVSKFSIAVNRKKRSGDSWEDEASFFDCTLFGKIAEALNQYLNKGKQVAIDGELRQSRWEQDGQSRSKVEIIVNNIQLLGSNKGGSESSRDSSGNYQQSQPQSQQQFQQRQHQSQPPASGNNEVFEDDIPF